MPGDTVTRDAAVVRSIDELAALLRRLRRRQARRQHTAVLTYRELAARTGWSRGIIGAYLTGRVLPPVDRFDELARQLGAAPAELGALATARDRVSELRPVVFSPMVSPRHLPADIDVFTGRGDELTALDDQLSSGTAVIAAVSGAAGVGKTALALHWAHRAAARFPDGQLYADLRGRTSDGATARASDALGGFLGALGVPASRMPAGLEARTGLYRSLLAGRRILVLLDDAADPEQVRPLLPATPGCMALITSRDRLISLVAVEAARMIMLDVLDATAARQLLAARLGRAGLTVEATAVEAVISMCGGLPWMLAHVAAHVVADPELTLGKVADALASGAPVCPFPGRVQPCPTWRHRAGHRRYGESIPPSEGVRWPGSPRQSSTS